MVQEGEVGELTVEGRTFLQDLFERCDRDRDGALNDSELHEAFATAPGIPSSWLNEYVSLFTTAPQFRSIISYQ